MKLEQILEGAIGKRGKFTGYKPPNDKGEIKKDAVEETQQINWNEHYSGKETYGISPVKIIQNGKGSKGLCRWIGFDMDVEEQPSEFCKTVFKINNQFFIYRSSGGRWHLHLYLDDWIDVTEARKKAVAVEEKLKKVYAKGVDTSHTVPKAWTIEDNKPGFWLFMPYSKNVKLKNSELVGYSPSGNPLNKAQVEFRYKWRKHLLVSCSVGTTAGQGGREPFLFRVAQEIKHKNLNLTLDEVNSNFNDIEDQRTMESHKRSIEKSLANDAYTKEHLEKCYEAYLKDINGFWRKDFKDKSVLAEHIDEQEDTEEQKEMMANIVFNMKDNTFHNIKTGREYDARSIKTQYQHMWERSVISEFEGRKPPEKQMVEMSVYRPDIYKPDASPLLDDERGFKTLNVFKPGGVEPMKPEGQRQERELEMFLHLVANLVTDEKEREWVHDTFSTIFQKTGKKIRHFNLFYSPHFQNGKSSVFKTIRKGLGANNCSVIGPVQAIDREKPFLADKMLVLVDELKIKGDYKNKIEVANLLKPFATETQHDVRPLFKGWREVHSTCNFMMATNHKDAISLPKNEARYTVIKVHKTRDQIGGDKFYNEYWDGLDLELLTGGTLANVVKWYYLDRTISSNFRQQGPCLTTPALLQMSEDAGHPMFNEMKRMFNEGDKPFNRTLFGVSEAWEHCRTNEKLRGQLNEFVENLIALGCHPYGECKHKRSGLKPALYSSKNHDFFQGMTKADIANKYWLPLDLKDGDQGPGKYNMTKADISLVVDKQKEITQWEDDNNETEE